MKENFKKPVYKIAECAIFIALSLALMPIEIPGPSFGGDIDLVMIPLFIIAFRHGFGYGTLSGAVFGLLKCLIGGGIGWGLPSVLLDYVLAYAAVGVAGIFKGKYWAVELSTFVGCVARFAIHFISGITIYMITVPTEVAGITFANPVLYSTVYNALYMLPNTVIAIIIMALLRVPLKKLNKKFN
ncbi:MAG: energy-coupled thiamine transporter ThiT [Acutalibacteraceae bacterium]|nr:energy-coupled thiamine transporter ThiT [Acutalibacteraceae bacterium]